MLIRGLTIEKIVQDIDLSYIPGHWAGRGAAINYDGFIFLFNGSQIRFDYYQFLNEFEAAYHRPQLVVTKYKLLDKEGKVIIDYALAEETIRYRYAITYMRRWVRETHDKLLSEFKSS